MLTRNNQGGTLDTYLICSVVKRISALLDTDCSFVNMPLHIYSPFCYVYLFQLKLGCVARIGSNFVCYSKLLYEQIWSWCGRQVKVHLTHAFSGIDYYFISWCQSGPVGRTHNFTSGSYGFASLLWCFWVCSDLELPCMNIHIACQRCTSAPFFVYFVSSDVGSRKGT